MPIGEESLGGYAREQLEAARRDPRLGRGHGAMIADFWAAVEEVERTRMMGILGLHELRRFYECEKKDFDASGGDQQREHEVQIFWQRAELARAEIENGHPALNAQALIGLNSALDALVEQFSPALRDLPFQVRMKQAEEEVPEAVEHLTPELRQQAIEKLQELLKVPKLKQLKGSGAARYERCLRRVGLGAPDDRPIPKDLDQALNEFGVIRDRLIHRAGRIDARALELAPSLSGAYENGQLVRLSDEDYRKYSAAIRCYGAEVIDRLYSKWPEISDPEARPDLDGWRGYYVLGA